MSIAKRFVTALERGILETGRNRARRHLLERGDRFLADAGFSRELLERGNGAWPWRVEDAAVPGPVLRDAGIDAPRPAALPASPAAVAAEPVLTDREAA